jgi:hypothetical protein
VKEQLGMSLGESLGELLPTPSRSVTKLLRPIHVPIARETEESSFPGLMLVYTHSCKGAYTLLRIYFLLCSALLCSAMLCYGLSAMDICNSRFSTDTRSLTHLKTIGNELTPK